MSERPKGTIAIIESDPNLREMLGLFVEELGFKSVKMSLLGIKITQKNIEGP